MPHTQEVKGRTWASDFKQNCTGDSDLDGSGPHCKNTLYPTKPKSLESGSQESAEIHAKYVLSTDYVAGSVGGVRNPTIP